MARTAEAPQLMAPGAASGSFRMLDPVSLQQVLEVVAEFDDSGGASLGLVAWELCADEDELVAPVWQQAISHGLIRPAGRDWQGAVVAAQFRGLGSRSKRAPQLLSRQLQEQERVGSKAEPIA